MGFKFVLFLIAFNVYSRFTVFGQDEIFDKVEKINDSYSIGYKSYDGEFYYNYDPYILSATDTVKIEGLNDWILGDCYASPYGEMASFETYKIYWVPSGDSSVLREEYGMLTMFLESAEILGWYTQDSPLSRAFVKVEKINENYSIGYISYDIEFRGYSDLWILSKTDTIPISGIEANICSIGSVSPNEKYVFFETISMSWAYFSETDSVLRDRWSGALVDLRTAEVLQYCRFDCGNEWNESNQWLSNGEIVFDENDVQWATNFSKIVQECSGDLNKDGISDQVVVTQDTTHVQAPYQLEIYFRNSLGDLELISKSFETIPEQRPNGHFTPNYGFSAVSIKNGVLSIEIGLLRGKIVYKFRYQNDQFELIGYTRHESNGYGELTFTDFNLSTGARVEEIEFYDSDKPKEVKHTTVWVQPLPNLNTFKPFGNDWN